MRCDDRLEIRLSAEDKLRVAQHADAARVSLSDFVRHSINDSISGRARPSIAQLTEVECLRRRVNSIQARLSRLSETPGIPASVATAILAIGRDLTTAHADSQELLRA
jgi:hypothetical protein